MPEPDVEQCRRAARHLLQQPLTCAEQHPEMFVLVRRHEQQLDRWFTQRLGYRLHVTSTTARLFKSTVVPHRRPLDAATSTPRPLAQREYAMLALVLAAVASGPRVVSLHDLVHDVRQAAADAEVIVTEEPADRRALVTALKWMIAAGVAKELHEQIDRYVADVSADAVIEIDPDRVALLPLPALGRAETPDSLLDRSDRRGASARQWMRARLVEDPALYREDLTDVEWSELRRRLGEEAAWLEEMFDLHIEARAEGVAAIDPSGRLTDRPFPTSRTVGHAALGLIDAASTIRAADEPIPFQKVERMIAKLAKQHRAHWARDLADDPTRLARRVLDLLVDVRLAEMVDADTVRVLPAAARYRVEVDAPPAPSRRAQDALW